MPLRVLHVIGVMNRAGAETMLMNLYRRIDRTKIQFDFLVHTDRAGDYDEEIAQLGGRLYRLPELTPASFLRYRHNCRAILQDTAHDHPIVHGHIGSTSAIYLSEARRVGCKTVMHSHASKLPLSPQELAFRVLTRPVRNIADYFIACSPEAGHDLFGQRVTEGTRYHVLPNAIDVGAYACTNDDHEQVKRQLGYEGNVLVGSVGRLIPVKNHAFALQVVRKLVDAGVDASFVIAGAGPLADDLKRQAGELGIADRVNLLGVRDDIPLLMKAFDLFLFPSVVEGLGLVAVEAQASGLPCLVSTGVPPSAVMTGHAVRISLDAGPETWAQTAQEMLACSYDRTQGAAEVRAAGFDVADTAEWLQDLYLRLARQ